MAMKTSLEGVFDIIAHEGIVTSRYKDSVGVWTIGVGHTAAAGAPDPAKLTTELTVADCIDLFRRDLAKCEARVNAAFKRPLKQHEFDAAVSFDYNTGAIHKATWVSLFNAGDRKGAIDAIMNWRKPPEIIGRRTKERDLFAKGAYSSEGFANVYPADDAGKVLWSKGRYVDLREMLAPVLPPPPDVEPAPDPDLDMRRMGEGGGMYVAGGLALMAAVIGAAMWWFG